MAEAGDFTSCGVCGRTILRGERVADYVAPDGARIGVCELCKSAAETGGWVPAELAGSVAAEGSTRRRGLGLRQRLSRASAAARGLASRPTRSDEHGKAEADQAPDPRPEPGEGGDRRRPRGARVARKEGARRPAGQKSGREHSAEQRQPARERSTPRERPSGGDGPAPRGDRRPRQGQPAADKPPRERPPSPERVLRTGTDHFNASREPRKVSGLIRSLGEPQVTVRRASAHSVTVTVAWELSWYQWEVSVDGSDGELVRQTAKGSEVGELVERDRAWNATAGADGTVQLTRAAVGADAKSPG